MGSFPRSRLVLFRAVLCASVGCAWMSAAPGRAVAQIALDEPAQLGDGPDPDCVAEVYASLAFERRGPTREVLAPVSSEPSVLAASEPGSTPRVSEPAPIARPIEPPSAPLTAPPAAPLIAPVAGREDLPSGRAIGGLEAELCLDVLRSHHVPFSRLEGADLEGVGIPIRLDGPLAGIEIRSRGGSDVHEIMDCRLAVALLAWAPALRARGVRRVLHYSTYRPGARIARSGHVSGHAKGLAIDLATLELADGSSLDVLSGWEARERGQPPCEGEVEEGERSAELRRMVCAAASEDLFQVVLTPHYDRAHGNHVHLEVVPGVTWSFIH